MKQEFKPIPGYEGMYEISREGEVYSLPRFCVPKRSRMNHCQRQGKKRFHVVLIKNGEGRQTNISHLVALAFVPNPNNYRFTKFRDGNEANHIASNVYWSNSSRTIEVVKKLAKEVNKATVDNKEDKSTGAWTLSSERAYFQNNKQAIMQQLINERK